MSRGGVVGRWWFIVLAYGLFAALVVPVSVSFDGILYLSSSRHLFGPFALDGYQWSREPLYAAIIRGIRLLGGTGSVWIIAVQAMAAALAAWIVTGAVLGRSRPRWVALGLILLNPLTLGYAGSVLQQTWITVILALSTGLVWMASTRRASGPGLAALSALVAVLSVHLVAPLAYVSVVTAAAVAWAWTGAALPDWEGPTQRRRAIARRLGAAALAAVAMLAFTRIAITPWHWYKDEVLAGRETTAAGLPTTLPTPSAGDLLLGLPARLPEVADTASVILDVPLPGAVSTWGGDENDFFGFQPFAAVRRCGVIQYNEAIQAASDDAAALLSPSCVSKAGQLAVNSVAPLGRTVHRIASYAFVLGLLCALWPAGRRALLMLVPAYAYWAMYSAYGASLDRYGFPLYAASVTMLVFLVGQGWALGRRVAGRRQIAPEAAEDRALVDHPHGAPRGGTAGP